MSNAITVPAATDSIDWDNMFPAPAARETRDLTGTGPKGTVREDRLVADADNRMATRPRRKR